jgi:hypothetical protein
MTSVPQEQEEVSVDEEEEELSADSQLTFVKKLKEYPALMQKSQVPAAKLAKTAAANSLIPEIAKKIGLQLTKVQLLKKINNMQQSVKNKFDLTKTGNKPIGKVQEWEKLLLELMRPANNPTLSKVPGNSNLTHS